MEAPTEKKLFPIKVFFKRKKRIFHPRENLTRSVRDSLTSFSSKTSTPLSNIINVDKHSLCNAKNLKNARVKYTAIKSPSISKPQESFILPGKMMQMLISQEISNPNQVISSVNLVRKCRTPSGTQQRNSIFINPIRNSVSPSTACQIPLIFRNEKLHIL